MSPSLRALRCAVRVLVGSGGELLHGGTSRTVIEIRTIWTRSKRGTLRTTLLCSWGPSCSRGRRTPDKSLRAGETPSVSGLRAGRALPLSGLLVAVIGWVSAADLCQPTFGSVPPRPRRRPCLTRAARRPVCSITAEDTALETIFPASISARKHRRPLFSLYALAGEAMVVFVHVLDPLWARPVEKGNWRISPRGAGARRW